VGDNETFTLNVSYRIISDMQTKRSIVFLRIGYNIDKANININIPC
jgi:hypothetical protein